MRGGKWALLDSNQQPTDYESHWPLSTVTDHVVSCAVSRCHSSTGSIRDHVRNRRWLSTWLSGRRDESRVFGSISHCSLWLRIKRCPKRSSIAVSLQPNDSW